MENHYDEAYHEAYVLSGLVEPYGIPGEKMVELAKKAIAENETYPKQVRRLRELVQENKAKVAHVFLMDEYEAPERPFDSDRFRPDDIHG